MANYHTNLSAMPVKKEATAEKPYFSEKRIREITQRLQDRVREHMRLQSEGKRPYCCRIPVTVMEIRHVMEVLRRSRSTAQKVMKDIREQLEKKPKQKVSVSEFCEKTGIPMRDVQRALDLLT